jgi:hypothetical protein
LKRNNNSAYILTLKRLQQKLALLVGEEEEAERQLARHTERQRCLLDLVLHQELVIEVLHGDLMFALAAQALEDATHSSAWAAAAATPPLNILQGSPSTQQGCTSADAVQPLHGSGALSSTAQLMLTCSDTSCNSQQQQQQQCSGPMGDVAMAAAALQMHVCGSAATVAHSSRSAGSCGTLVAHSYTAELLRTAMPAELYSVAHKTAGEWQAQFYELFLRIVVLLELINRSSDAAQAGSAVEPGNTTDAAAPAAAAASSGGSQRLTLAAGTSGAAAAGQNAAAAAAGAGQLGDVLFSGPQGALEELERLIDTHVRQVVIAYMFNHVPLLEACTADYATRQVSAPSPGHWQVSSSVKVRLELGIRLPLRMLVLSNTL